MLPARLLDAAKIAGTAGNVEAKHGVNILKSSSCWLKTTESDPTKTEKNELLLSSNISIAEFLDGAGI